jgi:hypothetical protein
MAASIGRYSIRDGRPWVRRKIDDGDAAAWLQRSQQACSDVTRLCEVVVDVSQEDRVTALARQVRRTRRAFQYDMLNASLKSFLLRVR